MQVPLSMAVKMWNSSKCVFQTLAHGESKNEIRQWNRKNVRGLSMVSKAGTKEKSMVSKAGTKEKSMVSIAGTKEKWSPDGLNYR